MPYSNKRIVVKLGTSALTRSFESADGLPLAALAAEICALRAGGAEILLVTSGAIGAGMRELHLARRPQEIQKKQAVAAIGQVTLMRLYQELFKARGVQVAQVLLSRGDFDERKRYLNARNTLATLLDLGAVPVINENDTVAVEEIQFGDNDRLSALVAVKMDADMLVILSDVEGLYSNRKTREVVPIVARITAEVENLAGKDSASGLGTGGMLSKIEAAKIAVASGVPVAIAGAFLSRVLTDLVEGKQVGTKFLPAGAISSRRRWMLFGAIPKGSITIDAGAARALKESKRSLLSPGIVGLEGPFRKGDIVRILAEDGAEIGRGISAFSAEDLDKAKGRKSSEVQAILGPGKVPAAVVHRDSLVFLP